MTTPIIQWKADEPFESARRTGLKVPQQIVFGSGELKRLPELLRGRTALVMLGAKSAAAFGLAARLRELCGPAARLHVGIDREPTVEMVDAGAAAARAMKPEIIVSAGGGSVMDCGKAVAALATNPGSVEDYLEGVGRGFQVEHPPLPHIAIPTVAGTGAEMTKNAVIASPEKGYKKSMRADSMIPTAALIDPELMLTVPPDVTAAGGMDAITQLIEPCISVKRRPETTALALEGLGFAWEALPACYRTPGDLAAREKMAFVSAASGICLANAGLAMAHGIAAALGALFGVAHGLACGILLPHTLRHNRSACARELAQALSAFVNRGVTIDEGLEAIEALGCEVNIPADLKYLRLTEADLVRLAEASGGTSMAGNPIPMTPETTLAFLKTIA